MIGRDCTWLTTEVLGMDWGDGGYCPPIRTEVCNPWTPSPVP